MTHPLIGHDMLSERKESDLLQQTVWRDHKIYPTVTRMESVWELSKLWLYLEAQREKQQEGVVKCLEINCIYSREMRRGKYKIKLMKNR